MKSIIVLFLLIVIPLGIMVYINGYGATPTHGFDPEVCTRYCHDHECRHFMAMNKEQAVPPVLHRVYDSNIAWLQSRPFGLGYQEANILLYIIVLPIFLVLGLWGVIHRRNG